MDLDHKKIGIDLFNATWDLINKKEKSNEDVLQMIHTAHASAYHWRQVGTPLNFQRSEWLISRVYALANIGESALFHAQKCMDITKEYHITGVYKAFAYEGIARAYSVLDNAAEAKKYLELAKELADRIADKEDRDYVISELSTIIVN